MKHLTAILAFSLIMFTACNKDDEDQNFEVEYKLLTSQLNQFTSIKYHDASGNLVEGIDYTNPQWTKKVTVSQKPFISKMTVSLNNTSSSPLNYDLVISVDGVVKQFSSQSAPPNAIHTAEAVYTVN